MTRPVVVLRDAAAARATCAALTAAGLDAVSCPLFTFIAEVWEAPPVAAFDALLLTSANAARHSGARLIDYADLPCHCVGPATAEAASAAGLSPTHIGDASSAQAMVDAAPHRCWLWLNGVVHSPIIVAPPVTLTAIPVYRSVAIDPPPMLDTDGAVVLVHSGAAAARLVQLVNARAACRVVAGSAAIADVLGDGWGTVMLAATPRDADMVAKARTLWQT